MLCKDESGVALLLTVFILSLASILVMEFSKQARFDMRQSHRFTEIIQSGYILKSALSLGEVLLKLPKQNGINEDWLGEPWALVASTPSLPISGFVGVPRLSIIDEDGKIDINAIASNRSSANANPNDPSLFWKNSLRNLFVSLGFQQRHYPEEKHRTRGNTSFGAGDQVAIIQDWIDRDTTAYSSASFDGTGIESSQNKTWFYNRRLHSLSELLLVPGMTLERLGKIAPYVRVSSSIGRGKLQVNINTAPMPVLVALGFSETQAAEIIDERSNLPISQDILITLAEGDPQLKKVAKLTSNEFSMISRVSMPSITRWVKAYYTANGRGFRRKTTLRRIEFH